MISLQSFTELPSSEPKLVWGFLCSAILHFILICLLVGVPRFSTPKKTYFSSAYVVKLVDLPKKSKSDKVKFSMLNRSKSSKVAMGKIDKGKSKHALKKRKRSRKKDSTLKVKSKLIKEGVAQTFKGKPRLRDAEKAFSLALGKIRKRVGERRRKEEIARVQKKIAEWESEEEGGGEGGESAIGSWGIPAGGGMIADIPLNYRLYYQVIEQRIKNNWNLALPRGVIEDMREMEVILSITIRSDGEITEISFEKKSGNIYLDDSAFRAIKKSSPLPPFSQYNIREPSFETGIIFPAGELL